MLQVALPAALSMPCWHRCFSAAALAGFGFLQEAVAAMMHRISVQIPHLLTLQSLIEKSSSHEITEFKKPQCLHKTQGLVPGFC